ncbi:MAG: hypothetical protein NTV79_06220, partial [Candidatus Aureabacteria bacterium]|nr:hypothetical protein [Candidatus Auribacterota bacterium]
MSYIIPLAGEKSCRLADPFGEFMQYYDTDYFWNDLYGWPDYWDGVHPAWWEGDYHIALAFQKPFAPPIPTPTPQPPAQIFVTSPNGGERLVRGTSYPITWTPAHFPGNIRLHLNQGGVLDHTIDPDTPNDGYYDWAIPGSQTVGSNYTVIVQSAAFPYLADSSDANFSIIAFATPRPQIDYNGDGRPDVAIWRPSTGCWAVQNFTRRYFGISGDHPVPADYNGDGRSEIAIFRSAAGLWRVNPRGAVYFGNSRDLPVPADYNGDGTEEMAIFRNSSGLWAVRNVTRICFGTSGDVPIYTDFDLDGRADVGIFRPQTGVWRIRGITRAYFGADGDYPVPADYLKQGRLQIAIARPGSGLWAIQDATRSWFGWGSFYPQPADWNGDGYCDIASFWNEYLGSWAIKPFGNLLFGAAGDLPVSSRIYSARTLGPAGDIPFNGSLP